jgi:hypothetical protein
MSPRPSREEVEPPGETSAAAGVEVRRGGADRHEAHVDIEAVPYADHIAKQSSVPVDTVSLRLDEQPHQRAGRQ